MVAILFTLIVGDYYFVYIEFHAIAFSIWFWNFFKTLLEHTKSLDHPKFFGVANLTYLNCLQVVTCVICQFWIKETLWSQLMLVRLRFFKGIMGAWSRVLKKNWLIGYGFRKYSQKLKLIGSKVKSHFLNCQFQVNNSTFYEASYF